MCLLYKQLKLETSLTIEALQNMMSYLFKGRKSIDFFKEMFFSFSRESLLEEKYIKDNISHREYISYSMKIFEENGKLHFANKKSFEF